MLFTKLIYIFAEHIIETKRLQCRPNNVNELKVDLIDTELIVAFGVRLL